ncbi:MAG: hypothetical protein J6Y82_08580 [Bacteroidales bacterium]|nr:hypothetical protein [Bacteroidales bacterium]
MKRIFVYLLAMPLLVACKTRTEGSLKSDKALFSVGESMQVTFSQGNLQYQPSTKLWRFAEKQNEFISKDNEKISDDYTGFIDLFGWGTSGWDSGAKQFSPTSSTMRESDYMPANDASISLTGEYLNADWGWYNKIVNGGNQEHIWRVLTKNEWNYLIFNRPNAEKLFGRASVDNVLGLVILPDEWKDLEGIAFKPATIKYADNEYTEADWAKMEAQGAVFLPCAGYRYGTKVYDVEVDVSGNYWSSTPDDADYAYALSFDPAETSAETAYARFRGHAVRLVYDIK